MVDDVTHVLFRRTQKPRTRHTSVVTGAVTEVSEDGQHVKVAVSDQLEPVWSRADGVTAIGANVNLTVGTDGKPIAAATTGELPPDAEPEYVGATGKRILDEVLRVDEAVQELEGVRDRLGAMDLAIVTAEQYLPVSTAEPTAEDGAPLGAIWRQVDDTGLVIGKWKRTADGWEPFTGGVVQAETVASAVGVFIDAMMENLTVTGAANIDEAAIGELTTRIAEIIRINVEQLYVGRDIRFTSSGLVFYAPPADGQDPEDWPNRLPLISITPTGDTSIAVAKDGAITAGITPQGAVWGKQGNFDSLTIAGRPVLELLNERAKGIIQTTRVRNNVSVNNTAYVAFTASAQLFKGRSYRINYQMGFSRTSGNLRVRTFLKWGTAAAVQVASFDVHADGDFTSVITFNADEFAFADGDAVQVQTSLQTVSSGATGTLWGQSSFTTGSASVSIEDTGPTMKTYDVNTGSPPAPPAVWYGPVGINSDPGVGIRPDGSQSPDTRLTLGGNSRYGSDMAEYVWYPINMTRLAGATVRAATVNFAITQGAPFSFALDVTSGWSPMEQAVNIYNGTANSNGNFSADIPASLRQNLSGRGGFRIRPFFGGQYAYAGGTCGVNLIYSK